MCEHHRLVAARQVVVGRGRENDGPRMSIGRESDVAIDSDKLWHFRGRGSVGIPWPTPNEKPR